MLTRCIRLAAFLSFVFLCFLRLNTFSFGIALDIAGLCGHMGNDACEGGQVPCFSL